MDADGGPLVFADFWISPDGAAVRGVHTKLAAWLSRYSTQVFMRSRTRHAQCAACHLCAKYLSFTQHGNVDGVVSGACWVFWTCPTVSRSSRGMELMMAIPFVVFGLTVVVGTTLAAVVVISLRTRRCGAIPRAPAAPIFFNAERQQHRFINLLGWCCHAKPRPDRQAWPTVLCRIYERGLADRREQHVLLKTSLLD